MNILKQNKLLIFAGLILTAGSALAEENLWLYTKGTDTRPQGSWELKLSDISRLGKDSGHYRFDDIRPEVEYGVTDKLTVGAKIMLFNHRYSVNDPELNPMYETQGGDDETFNKFQFGGFEVGAKYNVLSPYKDPLGLSFAAAFEHRSAYRLDGADIDQDSIVLQALVQKNFLDDTLVFALNSKVEFERRKAGGVLEEEIAFDISAGVSYRVAPKWFVGIEARWQSDFLNPQESGEAGNPGFDSEGFEEGVGRSSWDLSDMRLGDQFQYGTYIGPTLHYASEGWWLTLGALYQIKGGGDDSRNAANNTSGRNWDEHEKWHLGATVGFEF
ncbi:MAG: hypothetical protein ACI9E1_000103 [Cryomorphaceae bacterium]|jgi:hypothetical protein